MSAARTRTAYFFRQIGWHNLPLALALSLFARVHVWKIALPDRVANRFERLRPDQLFSRDAWALLQDECFEAWNADVLPHFRAHLACVVNYRGGTTDVSEILWQHLAREYEEFFLFLHAVRAWSTTEHTPASVVPGFICDALPPGHVKRRFGDARTAFGWINARLEAVSVWLDSVLRIGRDLARAIRAAAGPRVDVAPDCLFWTGISTQEIASGDGRLDFSWAARFGDLPPERVCYLVPRELSRAERAHLEANRIRFVEPAAVARLAPRFAALRAALHASLRAAADLVLLPPFVRLFHARFLSRCGLWDEIIRRCRPAAYVTSTSSTWPEAAEVALARRCGVRTIVWAYSANNLDFTTAAAGYKGKLIRRSLLVTAEHWTWNETVARWLESCQADPALTPTRFRPVGALMCGDRRHMLGSKSDARRALGLADGGFVIAVFDVPALSEQFLRKQARAPEFITPQYAEAFFSGIVGLLRALPDVRVILKLKRRLDIPLRFFPDSMRTLIDPQASGLGGQRVAVIDPGIDPYLPVAASDAALGMFFTSPVLLAATAGRPVAYYDPLHLANYTPEPEYLHMLVRDPAALIARVAQWRSGEQQNAGIDRLLPRVPAPALNGIFVD